MGNGSGQSGRTAATTRSISTSGPLLIRSAVLAGLAGLLGGCVVDQPRAPYAYYPIACPAGVPAAGQALPTPPPGTPAPPADSAPPASATDQTTAQPAPAGQSGCYAVVPTAPPAYAYPAYGYGYPYYPYPYPGPMVGYYSGFSGEVFIGGGRGHWR